LRLAKLRFAQQAGGYDKKRDDQHAHHISPCRRVRLPVILSVLPSGRNERPGAGSRAAPRRVAGPRWRRLQAGPGIERDFDARTIGWISGQNLGRIGNPCLLAMLKTCPPR
jgi:hypothetical protein